MFLHNFTCGPGGSLLRLSSTHPKTRIGFFLLRCYPEPRFMAAVPGICNAFFSPPYSQCSCLIFIFSQYYPLGPFVAPFMRISSVTLREAELHTDYLFCSANCPYFLYFSSLLSRDRWSLFVQANFGFSAPSCHRSAHRPASYFVTTCSLGKKIPGFLSEVG